MFKDKATNWGLALMLVLMCGIAGGVEAKAATTPKVKPLALEVVSQTWYSLPQAKQERYCDKRNVKRIVKRHHKGATTKGKRDLRRAYRFWLRDC